mgnify:CR=1 FL=1
MSETLTKFYALETALQEEVFERDREIHCALLAILARKHFFMVGVPGTAKSYLIRRLVARIDGLGDDGLFQWLLTRYTTPEEIFGPPDLSKLREGEYVRRTDRKLPKAKFGFLDEAFKASSSILNSLLTIINERLFFNGNDAEETDLCSIFAASNELPQDEGLAALWDRLHFRFEVHPLREGGSFIKMLTLNVDEDPEKLIHWNDIVEAQAEVKAVVIPDMVYEHIKELRDKLAAESQLPSERRFAESIDILRAEAWINGRTEVKVSDMRVLRHVLWSELDNQRTVERVVLDIASPLDREAHDLIAAVDELERQFNDIVADPDSAAKGSVEIFTKLNRIKERKDELKSRISDGDSDDLYKELHRRWRNLGRRVAREGFKMNSLT